MQTLEEVLEEYRKQNPLPSVEQPTEEVPLTESSDEALRMQLEALRKRGLAD